MSNPDDFRCNISFDIAYDPIICSCTPAHLFDMPNIDKWLSNHNTCPCSRLVITAMHADAPTVEASFPGIYAYIDANPKPDDDDDDFEVPDLIDADTAAVRAAVIADDNAQRVVLYTMSTVHDVLGTVNHMLQTTVRLSNFSYLQRHSLFHESLRLRTYFIASGRSSRNILRALSELGVFVHSFIREGNMFVFEALPVTVNAAPLSSLGFLNVMPAI